MFSPFVKEAVAPSTQRILKKRSWAEPYKIKVVEPLRMISREERLRALQQAGCNIFLLRSEDVYIDLLTDSGTSAMSDYQWAGMMLGDEAYAGSKNFYNLEKTVQKYYGYKYVVPTHQGRAAEHLISKILIKNGGYIPGNMYFATTRAHQELSGGTFVDVIIDEAHDSQNEHPFKGNVDLKKLKELIANVGAVKIPYASIAATVNIAGGQPISMANIREVRKLCKKNSIRIILDATRAMENAYFIQEREEGYQDKSLAEILLEFCSYSDGATMSGKKDLLVNIGGFLALNEWEIMEEARNLVFLFEGLHTYGGLAGRDMEAMARGVEEAIQQDHMNARIAQVQYVGEKLIALGVPIVLPIGGHAIFLDAKKFLPHIPQNEYPAETLAVYLYLESGIRSGAEPGIASAGCQAEAEDDKYEELELVRLAFPRRVYTEAHCNVVVKSIWSLFQMRDELKGLRMTNEPKHLGFVQATFELL